MPDRTPTPAALPIDLVAPPPVRPNFALLRSLARLALRVVREDRAAAPPPPPSPAPARPAEGDT